MSEPMNAREVKKVIEASIFNPTMRRDAKDFVDAQENRIAELEAALKPFGELINRTDEGEPGKRKGNFPVAISDIRRAAKLVKTHNPKTWDELKGAS